MMFGCARRCGGDAHSVFRMAAFLLMMTNVSRLDLHDEATPSFPGRQTGRRRVDLAGSPKARIRAAVRSCEWAAKRAVCRMQFDQLRRRTA